MQLSREQTQAIIDNGKAKGFNGKDILDSLIKKGYEPEGIDVNLARQALAKENGVQTPQEEPNFIDKVKSSLDTRTGRTGDILQREDTPIIEKGVQLFGQGAGLGADIIEGAITEIPGAKKTFETLGKGIKWLSESAPIKAIGEQIGSTKALQEATRLYDTDEDFKDTVDAVANIVRLGGDVQTAMSAVNFTKNVTNKLVSQTNKILPTSESVIGKGTNLKTDLQVALAKKNVNPQLENSANRLFLEGTKRIENPIQTYDKYLAQSKKALGDIKADPAISEVGSKMGSAFEKVIKQRKAVGAVIGKELKNVGKTKINILEPKTKLFSDLQESGLSYNPKTKTLTSFQGSKFAPEEVAMLDDFVKGIVNLGDDASVSAIDNFIAKTRSALAFTKGKSGVLGTTNAERIINGQIARLRSSLNPAVNGNKNLQKYWNANKSYSDLSDFIEEGSTFLGKKTLAGDFAKDASVAKSAVQSILNQGKKDFMLKLEDLTGYKAIDDAVLALQAMKDAGDFRGLSLLQSMSESGIPMSKAGLTQKVIDYTLSKGSQLVAGTPEQQTRAFLQSLEKSIVKPTTIKPTIKTTPTTGAKIKTNVQPKSSVAVMSKTIPQNPKLEKFEAKLRTGNQKIAEQMDNADLLKVGQKTKGATGTAGEKSLSAEQLMEIDKKLNFPAYDTGKTIDLKKIKLDKGATEFLKKEPSSAVLKEMENFLDYIRLKKLLEGFKDTATYEVAVRDILKEFKVLTDVSNATIAKFFEAVLNKAK